MNLAQNEGMVIGVKKSTIFKRILRLNLITIIISAIITGVAFYLLMINYTYDEKLSSMRQSVEKVAQLVDEQAYFSPSMSPFRRDLNIIADTMDSYIIIADTDGTITASSVDTLTNYALNIEGIADVLEGKEVVLKGKLPYVSGNKMLILASPLMDAFGQVRSIVVISATVPAIRHTAFEVLKKLVVSLLLALVFMIAISYLLSKRISKPIKEMNHAAGVFAKGDFSKRIKVDGTDEIAQLARSFNAMASSLDSIEKTRQSFVANVSHDLRTPITSIKGFVDGILDGTVPREDADEYLQIVSEEAARMSGLVNSFLDLTRLDNKEFKIEMSDFDINEIVYKIMHNFKTRISDKQLTVNVKLPSEPCVVRADKEKIIRVLTNLMENAVKFTNESGTISLTVESDKKAVVSIENSGDGISKEDLPFVFDRFYKGDKSRGENKNGTGLGLYISKNIINRHNNDLTVSSDKELTVFKFSLDKV